MSTGPCESAIARELAGSVGRRIARSVVADLRRRKQPLSGDDSVLRTTWDEICAQVQYERFFAWDAYDGTVRALVAGYVAELPGHERDAVWLQTEAGHDWAGREEEHRRPNPVSEDEVIGYLTEEYVYAEAGRWTNRRIRDYLERSAHRD